MPAWALPERPSLESWAYRATLSANYDPSPEQVLIGRQLQELTVQIDRQPGSVNAVPIVR